MTSHSERRELTTEKSVYINRYDAMANEESYRIPKYMYEGS